MNDDQTTPPQDGQGPDELEQVIGRTDEGTTESMPFEAQRRAASLTLRDESARDTRAASMEAANKSLADALRLAYIGVQVVMVLLIVLFALSGFKQVDQSEEGLRVRFGALQDGVLKPGPHLSWPKGFGEIVTTGLGQQQYQLSGEFMPANYDPSRDVDQQLSSTGAINLRPGADGSLITADGLLVHAQTAFSYRRSDIRDYNENIHPDYEERIAKAMVRRAMVHEFASTPIDDLLTRGSLSGQSSEDAEGASATSSNSSLETRLRNTVNRQTSDADYGISMDAVSIGLITPPVRLRQSFQRVLQVESEARTKREDARQEADRTVSGAAGTAAAPLLALMDEYERLLDLEDEENAELVLSEIFAVLDGDRNGANVEVLGQTYNDLTLGGLAAEVVGEALRESRTMGDIARREADIFNAKLEQYHANPRAFLNREWTEAMNQYLSRDDVTLYMFPEGVDVLDILLNADPEHVREIQRRRLNRITGNNERMEFAN